MNNKSWSNFWSGLIWFAVGFICILLTQIMAIIVLATIETIRSGEELSEEKIASLALDGDIIGFAFLFLLPMILAILAFATKFRRKQPFFQYIGLRHVSCNVLARWLLFASIFLVVSFICDRLFDRPLIPESMVTAHDSSDFRLLFYFSVALFGPISEELLYRGYIIKVWSESKIGPVSGTLILSLIWAGTHLQYDLYDMFWIFLMGILLCISRLKTNSIIPALTIHVLWNTLGVIMFLFYL